PLLFEVPEAARAQVKVGADHYRRSFGRDPRGIWLAECGYAPGADRLLAEEGIRYFFLDTHGLMDASPHPIHAWLAPIYTDPAVARARAEAHAAHFAYCRAQQLQDAAAKMDGVRPIVVAPYDTELFGHWWFEGPHFLDALFRRCATDEAGIRLITPAEYLQE